MIVSWEWLEQYTALGMSLETLTERLTMTGLNVEGTQRAGSDPRLGTLKVSVDDGTDRYVKLPPMPQLLS